MLLSVFEKVLKEHELFEAMNQKRCNKRTFMHRINMVQTVCCIYATETQSINPYYRFVIELRGFFDLIHTTS